MSYTPLISPEVGQPSPVDIIMTSGTLVLPIEGTFTLPSDKRDWGVFQIGKGIVPTVIQEMSRMLLSEN